MTYTERARALRPYIEKAAISLTDEDALQAVELFPQWVVDHAYVVDERLQYNNVLYRVVQAHTSQADWSPDITPALFTVIDETHAGTKEEPIPASRGMEYTYGLYYTDPEDSKLYLCERVGATAGSKITLQYLPHELIGQYFTEAAT